MRRRLPRVIIGWGVRAVGSHGGEVGGSIVMRTADRAPHILEEVRTDLLALELSDSIMLSKDRAARP